MKPGVSDECPDVESRALSSLKTRRSRFGIHTFDRDSGLNVLLEDAGLPADEWAQAPRFVSVALTNRCDLACSYCYAPKDTSTHSPETVLAWAKELDASGCLGIGLGGGEPTLFRGFGDLVRKLASETALAVTFTTHAHRLTEDLAVKLRGSTNFIRVSVDGVGSTYERLRGQSFADLARRLGLVASICPFGLNTVVNEDTVGELDAVADLARRSGADELLLLPQVSTESQTGIDARTVERLRAWLDEPPAGLRIAISSRGAMPWMTLADPFPGEEPLEAHAHIDASGTLRSDAFSQCGVPIRGSVLAALSDLRRIAK